MDINKHLSTLNIPNQLQQVYDLLAIGQATSRVTFWGNRVVEVRGYSGSIYLDTLGNKILDAAETRRKSDDLSKEDRIYGIEIVHRLEDFYNDTDLAIDLLTTANSIIDYITNYITLFFVCIREFNISPYHTTRFNLYRADEDFSSYGEAQFFALFGNAQDAMGDYLAGFYDAHGSTQGNTRYVVYEEDIRALP